jgi:hypothetical protein
MMMRQKYSHYEVINIVMDTKTSSKQIRFYFKSLRWKIGKISCFEVNNKTGNVRINLNSGGCTKYCCPIETKTIIFSESL